MKDSELIEGLSKVISMSEFELDHMNHFLIKYQEHSQIDFNIQTLINMFYSVIELTDGIYSLTYDKNVGAINILSRIHFETVLQLLVMIEGDYKTNILSYDYHQMEKQLEDNDFLISITDDKETKEAYIKEQEQSRKLFNEGAYKDIKSKVEKLRKGGKYSYWFIVTKDNPRSFNKLIESYFDKDENMKKYYGYLSKFVHNSNTSRFINHDDNTLTNIRRSDLSDTTISTVVFTSLQVLLKVIHFFVKIFDYTPYQHHEESPTEMYLNWKASEENNR